MQSEVRYLKYALKSTTLLTVFKYLDVGSTCFLLRHHLCVILIGLLMRCQPLHALNSTECDTVCTSLSQLHHGPSICH